MPDIRRVAVVLAVAVASACLAPLAHAHGGDKVGEAVAGGYRIELYAASVSQDGAVATDYTAYLRRVSTGFPVDEATVEMTVTRADGTRLGPLRANGFANGYDVVVPDTDRTSREGQRVMVRVVDGPEGTAAGRIVVRTSALPGGSPGGGGGGGGVAGWAAIGGAVAALLVALVWLSVRGDRGRRRVRPDGAE